MHLSIINLRERLIEAKSLFEKSLADSISAVHRDGAYPAWAWKISEGLSAREQVTCTLSAIYHQSEHADAREVEINPGLCGASLETIEAINQLNLAKDNLQKTLAKIDQFEAAHVNNQQVTTRAIMATCGWARLHRKQAVRKIPVIYDDLMKVGFIWAHTRDVQKISVCKARDFLARLSENPHVAGQMHLIERIPASETLAIVKQSALHIRANLLLKLEGKLIRKQIRSHVPIFFLSQPLKILPSFSPPKESSEKDPRRLKRFDIKLENTPFLPSINVYRYLPEHR